MEVRPLHKIGVIAAYLFVTSQGSAQVPPQAPLRPLAITQLDERQAGNDLDSARPVSISVPDPTPITDLLLLLVRDTRLSIVADPDVDGTFRGDLKEDRKSVV